MNKKTPLRFLGGFLLLLSLSGCAAVGPSIIKTYNDLNERDKIAILRVDQNFNLLQSSNLIVRSCDGMAIPHSVRYVLLKPGKHEIWFDIYGQTIVENFQMTNKKYLDAVAGHTYILKPRGGGGMLFVGDRFPEFADVTDDAKLHVQTLPQETEKK